MGKKIQIREKLGKTAKRTWVFETMKTDNVSYGKNTARDALCDSNGLIGCADWDDMTRDKSAV